MPTQNQYCTPFFFSFVDSGMIKVYSNPIVFTSKHTNLLWVNYDKDENMNEFIKI